MFKSLNPLNNNNNNDNEDTPPIPDPSIEPGQDEDLLAYATTKKLEELAQHAHPLSSTTSSSSTTSGFDSAQQLASRTSQTASEAIQATKDSVQDVSSVTNEDDVGIGHKVAGVTDYVRQRAGDAFEEAKKGAGFGQR
ncbi:uncharacterized protein SPPG_08331 [Spizellomyces punctatus DAOM BR117]|uniref:Uncharacterized protein n=1 Tax=Spizellomyces punctatus (strain DAOM BR117) TaxID=645134 RepID=A0A0L0H5J8_SPIPD|nr:uncharacterized protein SPPG_08331 [Spizellomyces punctatus DAOM BR117]KNC96176.1 hypothetical protein SPPG_08331 [Spizellomyces punctatus DAOM BR117]|eukprot:XP_016604216.1 hypothetical protein SPPG_08331 [Spizellomyces punctatus DAOM BR117]